MKEKYYLLVDPDNRDPDRTPFESRKSTLSGFIGYVDGPLRSDLDPESKYKADEIIRALRQEDFPLAQLLLYFVGVDVSKE